jgi:hypothetical protein
MNAEAVENLLLALGTKQEAKAGVWHRSKCPLAFALHKSGKDTHPSFGIANEEGLPLRFHCFTCETGDMPKLFQTLEFLSHKFPGQFHGNLQQARQIVEENGTGIAVLPEYSEFKASNVKLFEELPQYILGTYKPALMYNRASKYLLNLRGLTEEEVLKFNIRYDADADMVLFPYWDVFDRLAGVRGRKIVFPGEYSSAQQHHDYVFNKVNNAQLTFYNEQCLNLPGPVVVVEGQVDCIKVCRVWPKTVANLTAKPVLEKAKKLSHTEGAVFMMDGDQPGRAAQSKWVDLSLFLGIPCAVVELPYDEQQGVKTDPDSVGEEFIRQKFVQLGLLTT